MWLLKASGIFWRSKGYEKAICCSEPIFLSLSLALLRWLPGPVFPWDCIFREELCLGHSWLGVPQRGAGELVHSPAQRHSSTDSPDTASPAFFSTRERSCWSWRWTWSSQVPPPASQTPKALDIGAQIRAASEVTFAG